MKCRMVLNLMRAVAGYDWGSDRQTLLYMYHALIRSFLDYGFFVYRSAAKTVLRRLERIQSRALSLCVGAFRMTPVEALQVDSGELPLRIRRDKIALAYWARLKREFRRTSCGHSNRGMLGASSG